MGTARRLLVAFVVLCAIACRSGEERCALCGMPIDPSSSWRADLKVDGASVHFDSPRCALRAWRSGRMNATTMRVIDYYDRRWREASEVLFVAGSDVNGPMGPDLVPVDPARAQKFAEDHSAGRPVPVDALTLDFVSQLR